MEIVEDNEGVVAPVVANPEYAGLAGIDDRTIAPPELWTLFSKADGAVRSSSAWN